MQTQVNWSSEVKVEFPELNVSVGAIYGVHNLKASEQIGRLRTTIYGKVRAKHNIETLKDDPAIRAYRSFYWKLQIDPTKTRPSGEALLRRVLHGDDLPAISSVVDAYNLASLQTTIPISGFDLDRLNPPLEVRFARNGEDFVGIGMDKPALLTDKMLVLSDERQVLCIYPYRDSDHTKVTLETRDVLVIGYGVPGISSQKIQEANETAITYIKLASQGESVAAKVFSLP